MGAAVTGIDLADLDGETWGAVRAAYRPAPPLATILRSITLPELGGDTMFASMTEA